MHGSQKERQTSCTVAVELNRYGAMTLRSEAGRTYQVVDSDGPTIADELAELPADSRVSVTLQRAPGRGNSWRVTDIESGLDREQSTPRSLQV